MSIITGSSFDDPIVDMVLQSGGNKEDDNDDGSEDSSEDDDDHSHAKKSTGMLSCMNELIVP